MGWIKRTAARPNAPKLKRKWRRWVWGSRKTDERVEEEIGGDAPEQGVGKRGSGGDVGGNLRLGRSLLKLSVCKRRYFFLA